MLFSKGFFLLKLGTTSGYIRLWLYNKKCWIKYESTTKLNDASARPIGFKFKWTFVFS